MDKKNKEFFLSSWAINNKTIIYVLMIIFLISGISAYKTMPRELFPEINSSNIFITTVFPGNNAEEMEKLITDPLEQEIKGVIGLIEIESTSSEGISIINIEFDDEIPTALARQRVKDLVENVTVGDDWPTFNNAKVDPNIFEFDIAERFPVLNISLVGDYKVEELKEYAEYLDTRIERLPQVKTVEIRGIQDFEVEVAVNPYMMKATKTSYSDIINAIAQENVTISAGSLISDGQRRNVKIIGEVSDPSELNRIIVKRDNGPVYLEDVASISFKEKEITSYTRSFDKKTVMLEVVKRGGENAIFASNSIQEIIQEAKEDFLPSNLEVVIQNDQSEYTINSVNDLMNNLIFGIILVVTVLTFFLGLRNALFVGFAIPMSMFMSLVILSAFGLTLNRMVLFGLVMGLGLLVDNGIVVVENIYRLMSKEGVPRIQAAKLGIGEVALPIIVSTATTIAAFIPLGTWPGTLGEFMIYFPITLSAVLGSSLIVAIFFNSMLVSSFMDLSEKEISRKNLMRMTYILGSLAIVFVLFQDTRAIGSLLAFICFLFWSYKYFIKNQAIRFQNTFLVRLENKYNDFLSFALEGIRPFLFLAGTFLLFITSIVLMGIFPPKIEFFPDNEPQQILVYLEYPEGTDIEKTNETLKQIESEIYEVINNPKYLDGDYNFLVESAISQVGEGAGNPETDAGGTGEIPHKALITMTMREFKYRRGMSSEELRKDVQLELIGRFPGIAISVEKDSQGPPGGYPVNIEIYGDDYEKLIETAISMKNYLNKENIEGIEQLKIDVSRSKPGLEFQVDREKAGELGIPTGLIGQTIRNSIIGTKAGVYKLNGDDYQINVRLDEDYKNNINTIINQNIIFRDQSNGKTKEIPIASVVTEKNITSFSAIKHKDLQRSVTLYSSILAGSNANEIVNSAEISLSGFETPQGVDFKFTGEIKQQAENQSFLSGALLTGIALILLLLVFQFNSISKPFIVLASIILSFTGVFLGIVIFNLTFSILMTMLGIISLTGIIVNNAVVLIDYTQLLFDRKKIDLNLSKNEIIEKSIALDLIKTAGKARLKPVLLTAITTIFGLIPLAIGLNIDFFSLFANWNANIYIGGDNVIFWGPLAWTVIFGITFATFLTLIIVPSMYYIIHLGRIKLKNI
ncbi:efflux RND transporter permease subunit [Flavobacteriaceae bacterium]|nr:efflux RND transporter permease subunit [Flavobacteriaceae bacterium]MDA9276267.1 efflux RND transporter permease subunit [Flavobacteriaceae bacterium]MDC0928929.1 efflux RND transporter permease subunit [Flavobacteriaceae bacterium]